MSPTVTPPLSVIVFAFNEAENIAPVLGELCEWLRFHEPNAEVIFVDDGSTDATAGEAERARTGSLRWGIVMVALALGFGLVEAGGWTEMGPGVIGILLGATGLGNLAFYAMARRQA